MTDYIYRPLDQAVPRIRVLELFCAATEESDIHCQLHELPISQSRGADCSYEALSYFWGSDQRPLSVYINGHPLPITQNLDTALRHLRRKSQNRRLWVDAICINQADREEKRIQIGLMRHIFAEASTVLVWLGPGDQDTDRAIAVLVQRARRTRESASNEDVFRPILAGLQTIFTSPWWSRIWVFEEVLVATEPPLVICGHSQITWTDLDQERLRWEIMLDIADPNLRDIHIHGTQEFMDCAENYYDVPPRERMQNVGLFSLLSATSHRIALDPRDKVFAVLGLVTDGSGDLVQPDYEQSVSQIYQKATLSILNSEVKFDLLHRVHSTPRRNDLPTWCPDFSCRALGLFDKGDLFPPLGTTDFETDRGMARELVTHDASAGSIRISGVEVGEIAMARPSAFTSNVIAGYRTRIGNGMATAVFLDSYNIIELEWSKIARIIYDVLRRAVGCDEANRRLASGETWRLLNAGRVLFKQGNRGGSKVTIAEDEFGNGYWLFEKYLRDRQAGLSNAGAMQPWWDLIPNSNVQNLQSWVVSYMLKMPQTLEDTCFFITKSGLYGISALCVEEGDVLCVLFGCRLPAILRPHKDKKYQLVSFAYVPVIMHGELFTDTSQIQCTRNVFEII
ncbi:hypothetical protein EIK77_005413 [Talaromyces pinophilus]|nr:hypothetical protein EIK77_005413 [Talaromyces pinophilus]